ncbi:MAG: MBOAT family protein [Pseudomonadota bacterium]
MLFNSYIFISLFLPITLITYYFIGGQGKHRIAISWLVGASLFFYGWWNPAYLGLIVTSMLFNYAVGISLGNHGNAQRGNNWVLALGVTANLALLGYYKYANFFVNTLNDVAATSFHLETIILPLAISFFTFQQVAYLVDAWKGETREYNFLHYCLFVTFFPQLIAGPIVHHKEMLPQFAKDITYKFNHENIAVGLTIFFLGLFKKVVIADSAAKYSTPVFDMAEDGMLLNFFEAWMGALAYTFQLYFDFSGYSDMAIGLARMFGIRLPLNFNSPYKANNIIDFWRGWHMTLSRFLRDYLYIPLGGNRKGRVRRHVNLMITMVIGGLWHGAGWTFVAWGALHGAYLIVNHVWRNLSAPLGLEGKRVWIAFSRLLTFLAIVVAWVFFRAESFDGALVVLQGMSGMNGVILPDVYREAMQFTGMEFAKLEYYDGKAARLILVLLLVVWFMPNTQQIMYNFKPAFETYANEIRPWVGRFPIWKPNVMWAAIIVMLAYASIKKLSSVSEFLYFQF